MKTIYIAIRVDGEYEDYAEYPMRGFTTLEKAKEFIAEQERLDNNFNIISPTMSHAFHAWVKENPLPTSTPYQPIYPDSRNEEARKLNAEILEHNQKERAEWQARAIEKSNEILDTHNVPPEMRSFFHLPLWQPAYRDFSYVIDQLEVEGL